MLDSEAVKNVLSLMYSCGMYNYSGQFAFKVTYCRTSANIKMEGSRRN
jgi:glutaminase